MTGAPKELARQFPCGCQVFWITQGSMIFPCPIHEPKFLEELTTHE